MQVWEELVLAVGAHGSLEGWAEGTFQEYYNDWATHIVVPVGCKAVLFEDVDFAGMRQEWAAGAHPLSAGLGTMSRAVSSARVLALDHYSSQACYEQALQINPSFAKAWNNLGFWQGGWVSGEEVTPRTCYVNALEGNRSLFEPWFNLALLGGWEEPTAKHTVADCYRKALELNPLAGEAWNNLGAMHDGASLSYTNQHQCAGKETQIRLE